MRAPAVRPLAPRSHVPFMSCSWDMFHMAAMRWFVTGGSIVGCTSVLVDHCGGGFRALGGCPRSPLLSCRSHVCVSATVYAAWCTACALTKGVHPDNHVQLRRWNGTTPNVSCMRNSGLVRLTVTTSMAPADFFPCITSEVALQWYVSEGPHSHTHCIPCLSKL